MNNYPSINTRTHMLDRLFHRAPAVPAPICTTTPPADHQLKSVEAGQHDILKRLVRIETRLCNMMEQMNLDPRNTRLP